MQTPPPFPGQEGRYQAPIKPKKNPVVIIFAILGVLTVCCAAPLGAVVFFGYKGFQGAMGVGGCFINAGMITKAMEQYVAEKGVLPPAATWQTDLSKYLEPSSKETKEMEKLGMKLISKDGEWSCESSGQKTGFSYNQDVAGKKLADLKKSDGTPVVAVFETNTVAFNQHSAYKALPFAESPNAIGDLVKEKRGWIVTTIDGQIGIVKKSGKIDLTDGNTFKVKVGNGSQFPKETNAGSNQE